MQHSTGGGWAALPCKNEVTAADSRDPEPSSCCAALQVWLGLFPVQTVMIAVVCVSCVLLSPRVDVEARSLQVCNLGLSCFCSIKPRCSQTFRTLPVMHRAVLIAGTASAQRIVFWCPAVVSNVVIHVWRCKPLHDAFSFHHNSTDL